MVVNALAYFPQNKGLLYAIELIDEIFLRQVEFRTYSLKLKNKGKKLA